ncbi:MAG: M20/M25/M40 family metallo-hydrolase [Jatrophihabitans sp.]|uniref:M20/M25/M40 family metallo-hydrolase n=1 Tax=Jatrophihabitans sp. TaxID=1932789 RepID=UPI003F821DE2
MTTPDAPNHGAWLREHEAELVDRLTEWCRIPSVAGEAGREAALTRSANWLAAECRDVGFPTVEVWDADGFPAVFAEWPADGPRVLVYSHHDVRMAQDDEWEVCPPFEPLRRGRRLFGRGTSDAKGQVLAHLFALRALLASGADAPPVHLMLLVEGEEEAGSAHFADLLDAHVERLAADLVMVSDTMTWSAEQPAVVTGNRGMMKAQVEVRGPERDIHAGAVSGVAPNPATALVRLLAQVHDDDGRVAMPGFYDEVREASDAERGAVARLTADEDDWLRRTRTRAAVGESGRSIGERLYLRPAVEVGALASGDPAPPTRGTIAARALGELQFGLVPDQDPAKITELVRAWVVDRLPDGFTADVTVMETINQPPYVTPEDHPALAVLTEAMGEAWGAEPGRMRNAGSGPGALLHERLGAPIVFFGTGLPDDHWHGPDESVDLDVLRKGATTLALCWPRLARALR